MRAAKRGSLATSGRRRGLGVVAAMTLLLVSGCGAKPKNPDPGASRPSQTRSQALIDAGNQAYRDGNYSLAARRYAAATEVKSDDPAAYYGLGMALAKLGRDEEARVAYARARELARSHKGP